MCTQGACSVAMEGEARLTAPSDSSARRVLGGSWRKRTVMPAARPEARAAHSLLHVHCMCSPHHTLSAHTARAAHSLSVHIQACFWFSHTCTACLYSTVRAVPARRCRVVNPRAAAVGPRPARQGAVEPLVEGGRAGLGRHAHERNALACTLGHVDEQ